MVPPSPDIPLHPHNCLAAVSSCLRTTCLPPPRHRQDTFQEARAANASSAAAGAMFWGATVGAQVSVGGVTHMDWDGWQVRLDGGRTGERRRGKFILNQMVTCLHRRARLARGQQGALCPAVPQSPSLPPTANLPQP